VQANSNGAAVVMTSVEKSLEVVVPPPSMGLLSLKASAPSWVQVVDANGVVQLSRTLLAGEVAEVTGAAPLTVVIGRADALEVAVRGKPFSLLGVAKDNVARFEVK
jgi:cytoskeleton protein RodZ